MSNQHVILLVKMINVRIMFNDTLCKMLYAIYREQQWAVLKTMILILWRYYLWDFFSEHHFTKLLFRVPVLSAGTLHFLTSRTEKENVNTTMKTYIRIIQVKTNVVSFIEYDQSRIAIIVQTADKMKTIKEYSSYIIHIVYTSKS